VSPPAYDQVTVDDEVAIEVKEIYDANPGLWPSRRALYHDLLRRGLLNLRTQLRGVNRVSNNP